MEIKEKTDMLLFPNTQPFFEDKWEGLRIITIWSLEIISYNLFV